MRMSCRQGVATPIKTTATERLVQLADEWNTQNVRQSQMEDEVLQNIIEFKENSDILNHNGKFKRDSDSTDGKEIKHQVYLPHDGISNQDILVASELKQVN